MKIYIKKHFLYFFFFGTFESDRQAAAVEVEVNNINWDWTPICSVFEPNLNNLSGNFTLSPE